MSLQVVPPGPMTLADLNVGASIAANFMVPLGAQIDLAIFGPSGVGSIQADLVAQFNTALSANADLAISLTNPFATFQETLAAVLQQIATLQLAMALGVPSMSIDIATQIAANAALVGSLSGKLGGISALIEGALQVKAGAMQFAGELQANLSAGPIDVLTFGFDTPMTATEVGNEAAALFQALPGIAPSDSVSGVMIVTKDPAAAAAIASLFKVS